MFSVFFYKVHSCSTAAHKSRFGERGARNSARWDMPMQRPRLSDDRSFPPTRLSLVVHKDLIGSCRVVRHSSVMTPEALSVAGIFGADQVFEFFFILIYISTVGRPLLRLEFET